MAAPGIFDQFMRALHGDRKVGSGSPSILRAARVAALRPDLHVFEFGHLWAELEEQEHDFLSEASEEAARRFDAGTFRLPFPRCAFTFDGDKVLDRTGMVLLAEEQDDSIIVYSIWRRGDGVWIIFPGEGEPHPGGLSKSWIPDDCEFEGEALEHTSGALAGNCRNAMIMTVLLSYPESITDEDATPSRETARLRAARKLPKLPPTRRILHINKMKVVHPAAGVGHGSPKSPHDRRSHERHYRSGKVTIVRASQIKGGAKARQTYVVKD